MSKRLKYILIAAAITIFAALYFIFDPARSKMAPKCTFKFLTGYDCPGCGSQRMLHALLHGDIAAAWQANAVLLCMIPLLAIMIFAAMTRLKNPRLYAVVNSLPVIISLLAITIIWTILRNI